MKRLMIILLVATVSIGSICAQATAGPRLVIAGASFRVVRLVGGLEYPWALAFLPDGRFLVSERLGRLLVVETDGRRRAVSGLTELSAAGQGGLLDLALHPDFARNNLVYWTYSATGPGGSSTALARGRLEGYALKDTRVLWTMPKRSSSTVHYGSRLRFGADGKLYLTTGERGDQNRARDPGDAAGKVIRINDDGSVPPDNPFAGKAGYLPELYSIGHRNPQGLAVRPGSGQLWLTEHGPRGGDEVNLAKPGLDYGWPLATYGIAYSGARIAETPTAPGIEPPLHYWTPSIAPSGLDFYQGDAFPSWRGKLLAGSLAGQKLVLLSLNGDTVAREDVLLDGAIGRIRDVRVGSDGLVYLLTDDRSGSLYRLEPVHSL